MHRLTQGDARGDRLLPLPAPPAGSPRQSAVLMLFGWAAGAAVPNSANSATSATSATSAAETDHQVDLRDQDVVLTERSHQMRSHPAQVSFPGGALEPADSGAAAAALREAEEEVGIDPSGVEVLAELAPLYLPPSRFVVTPVLAWWTAPHPLTAVDPREVAAVDRVPLAELVDPANRFMVTHPSGWTGPGFEVAGLFVWGFTAGLLDAVLDLSGLAPEWDTGRLRSLPERFVRQAPGATTRHTGEAS